jgi:hypothetical protein
MADWFGNLARQGVARTGPAAAGVGVAQKDGVGREPNARDGRYDAIVRTLREREVEDRQAREKRLSEYKQALGGGSGSGSGAAELAPPARLYRFPTKVPCRVTPEARALLEQLRKKHPGSAVTFQHVSGGKQALVLSGGTETEPRQIGWVEHCVQTDPKRCNVRNQGLTVETDGRTMLVLRFRYPATAVRMSSRP